VDQVKSSLLVDAAGGDQLAVCPKSNFLVASSAGESHTLIDKPATEAKATSFKLDKQQPKLGRMVGLPDQHDESEDFTVPIGNPAALSLRIVMFDEVGHDFRDNRFKLLVVPVLLRVQLAVAVHDPSPIAGCGRTQCVWGSSLALAAGSHDNSTHDSST
jgi:hypothetical protein